MKKIIIFLFISVFLFASGLNAQVDDDFEKFKREYEQGINQLKQEYKKFVEQADKEFADFLKKEWEEFELFKEMKPVKTPGPEKLPVFDKIIDIVPAKQVPIKKIEGINQTENFEMKPRMPIPVEVSKEDKLKHRFITFNFYGSVVQIVVPPEMCEDFNLKVSEKNIASYWEKMINQEYNELISQILKLKSDFNLNDWGLLELTKSFTQTVSTNKNTQRLLQWFVLTKLSYKTKIGYKDNDVYLLIPSVNQVFGNAYYTFNGLKYYVFGENPGSIYTYNADYSLANQIMNFNLYTVPNFYVKEKTRNIEFKHNSENYVMPISYNENLINFYSSYPQCDIGLYFDAGVSELTKESLAKVLWPIIHKMDEKEAVYFLLNMVQTGFEYQTDEEQFGAERYFFPEEILYHPYSDCEDRAVFFAFLVNEYLQLPVISLCYPMHVATAVNFTDKTYGDFVKYNGDNYTVCDPTYINAPIGATMPQYKKSKLDIIAPEKRMHDDNQPVFVWERIYSAGGSKLGGTQDLVYLKDNSYVVAGFFKDSLSLSKTVYNTDKNTTGLFIAIYDKSDNLVFINTLQATGYIAPDGLTIDKNSNIYVTGQFAGSMKYDKLNIKASSPDDQFVLKMNSKGTIDWLAGIKLDTVTVPKPYAFQCLLSEKGEIQGFMFVKDESLDENIKIYENEQNLIAIAASRGMSESGFISTTDFESSSNYDLVNTWKSITDHYIALRYNKNIAGFFALIETMEQSNLNVSGKEILATLNTLNPEFQTNYKGFYDELRNLTKLSSKNGVVSFYTDNGKVVKCGPISITNGAQAQMRNYKSGNKQINTMKGIYYDTLFRSKDINYIKFFKVNGDLMIDYSKDHNQKVINTEKDILRL